MTVLAGLRRCLSKLLVIAEPVRWVVASRWRTGGALAVLLTLFAGPALWWRMQLMGLPDIGDPYDVEAFLALTIPDDRNAYCEYRRAWSLFKPAAPKSVAIDSQMVERARWSEALPGLKRWAEDNREAMAVYRQGTDRPDALDKVPRFESTRLARWDMHLPLISFTKLALLEGSRLEELGDMEGAWGWYRAVLRSIHHVGMKSPVSRRHFAQRWHDVVRDCVSDWAANPRTTPALIRGALDAVVECEALAPSESYTLKAEYLDGDPLIDSPLIQAGARRGASVFPNDSLDNILTPGQIQASVDLWLSCQREPERSRRVLRLAIANWLGCYELPPADRPPPDLQADGLGDFFYQLGPKAPAQSRALPPRALAAWLDSTFEAKFLLSHWGWKFVRGRERQNHRSLLILLGEELYRRDFGTDPSTPEMLVGRYLKSLPPESPDDARHETVPISDGPPERPQ